MKLINGGMVIDNSPSIRRLEFAGPPAGGSTILTLLDKLVRLSLLKSRYPDDTWFYSICLFRSSSYELCLRGGPFRDELCTTTQAKPHRKKTLSELT